MGLTPSHLESVPSAADAAPCGPSLEAVGPGCWSPSASGTEGLGALQAVGLDSFSASWTCCDRWSRVLDGLGGSCARLTASPDVEAAESPPLIIFCGGGGGRVRMSRIPVPHLLRSMGSKPCRPRWALQVLSRASESHIVGDDCSCILWFRPQTSPRRAVPSATWQPDRGHTLAGCCRLCEPHSVLLTCAHTK